MKGLVFIEDGEIGLRFAGSTAFRRLAERHELLFVCMKTGRGSPQIRERLERDGYRVTELPVHAGRSRRWQDAFSVTCLVHRKLSPSFEQRAIGMVPELKARVERYAVTEDGYREYRDQLEREMGLHPELLALTQRERPDFFVIPSSLLDLHTDDALQIGNQLGVASLLLVAGWDNPSSKGLLYRFPTRIGAWGEQSKRHIIDIQRMPEASVRIVGAPHFEPYREPLAVDRATLRKKWGVPVEGKLVVFAGTLRLFDETSLLQEIDAAIDAGRLGQLHVLYRPHPWRFKRTNEQDFTQISFRHVTLDPTLEGVYRRGSGRPPTADANFLRRANDLHELYTLCDAVVTPMSSLLLESMINGLPVMAVAFGDGKHGWSADKVARMLHFEELYEMPEVIVCRERGRFFEDLAALLAKVGDAAHAARLRELSQYFHYQDAQSYGERVAAVVDEMLAARVGPPAWTDPAAKPGRRYRVETWLRDGLVARGVRYLAQRLTKAR